MKAKCIKCGAEATAWLNRKRYCQNCFDKAKLKPQPKGWLDVALEKQNEK